MIRTLVETAGIETVEAKQVVPAPCAGSTFRRPSHVTGEAGKSAHGDEFATRCNSCWHGLGEGVPQS